jgi:hypothetical protein
MVAVRERNFPDICKVELSNRWRFDDLPEAHLANKVPD